MSSHKTENYKLHTWEPGDDFLRSEFNANFAALDTAVRMAAGVCAGDGEASQFINLGFTPAAVLVVNSRGQTNVSYYCYGGLALPGSPVIFMGTTALEIVSGGFKIGRDFSNSSYHTYLNSTDNINHYIALR